MTLRREVCVDGPLLKELIQRGIISRYGPEALLNMELCSFTSCLQLATMFCMEDSRIMTLSLVYAEGVEEE